MLTLNDGRNELWQWDTKRKLTVDAECSQVHFSNKVFGRSIDVDVADGMAIIPDILLQTDKELTAWAFVGTAENGYTKISKAFKVNPRNKPADYVFTPHDQTTLGEIVQRLEELEAMQDPDAIKNAVDEYLTNNPIEVEETDPTVPDWAKQPTKPKYMAVEVGAIPDTTEIPVVPTKVSAFENDAGYLTEHQDLSGYAKTAELPKALPNPHPLTFTGAVDVIYDGSKPVEVAIPQGGGASEWKRIARVEVTEDNVPSFLFTEDENGNPFSATDFTIRLKAVKRSSVSSIRICEPRYRDGVADVSISPPIGQMNAFGNTGGDRYYTIQLTKEGDWRKVFGSESNADIFSTKNSTYAVANNVYASGVTYTIGNVVFPLNELFIYAANGFFTGDIIEVWYK